MGIFWLIVIAVLLVSFIFTAHIAIFASVKLITVIAIIALLWFVYKIFKTIN